MRIPSDCLIAEEKIRDYLLKPLEEDDKSKFLNQAGYNREEYWELIRDLREQILPLDAALHKQTRFGKRYLIRAVLRGPNGKALRIRTFWENNHILGWKFITLIPDKERSDEI